MDFLDNLLDTANKSDNSADERVNELRTRIQQALGDNAHKDLNLGDLEQAAIDSFDERHNSGEYDPSEVENLKSLADIIDAVRAESAVMAEEKAERDEQVKGLADRVKNKTQDTEPEDEADDDPDSDGTGVEDTAKNAPDFPQETPDDQPGDEAPAEGDRQLVSAQSRRGRVHLSARDINENRKDGGRNTAGGRRATRSYSITAAADVPDTATGKSLTMSDLTQAVLARVKSMPIGQPTSEPIRKSVANINRHIDESLIADGQNPARDAEIVERVSDEKRLPGGSLVAAAMRQLQDANSGNLTAADAGIPVGGAPPNDIWCSPSETDFSLVEPWATRTGILDLPSFQVRRGGIRYPRWLQYPDMHRPMEHGNPNNDQPQGLQGPIYNQANQWNGTDPYRTASPGANVPPEHQNMAYTNPNVSDGPRHDWHGYVDTNGRVIGETGEWVDEFPDDLQDPDYYIYNPKKFLEGPCVSWDEQRMHNSYLAIRGDLLREHTYPELAERFISDALVSHAHYMNETYIKWIVAHSDRLPAFYANVPEHMGPNIVESTNRMGCKPMPGPMSLPWQMGTNAYWPGGPLDHGSSGFFGMGSAAEAVLERIGYLATWLRNTYRMPFTTSIEGFAPFWFREFLKLDIERKINRPHGLPVSNAEVEAYLSQWGVRLQWVYDWQDLHSTEQRAKYDTVFPTHLMPRDGWPNNVDIVLYPAGSWALAEQNVLRLDAEYGDTDNLRQNKYTALFTEDAWMLLNKHNRSFIVELRNLCPNGAVGAVGSHDYPCNYQHVPEAQREEICVVTPQESHDTPPTPRDTETAASSSSSSATPSSGTSSTSSSSRKKQQ